MGWRDGEIVAGTGSWQDGEPVRVAPSGPGSWQGGRIVEPEQPALTEEQREHFLLAAKREAALASEWEKSSKSNLPGFRSMAIQMGANIASPVARLLGQGERADQLNRLATAAGQVQEEREKGGPIPDWLQRAARGAGVSIGTAGAAGMFTGPYGIIGSFSAQEGNRAWTEGKDAGLKGKKLAEYVLKQATIEAVPALVMQKLGLGGFEKILGGKQAASAGLREGFKRAGLNLATELPEELVTELAHNFESAFSGVDPNAMSAENIQQTVLDTVAQTVLAMGAASVPSLAAAHKEGKVGKKDRAKTALVESAESGVPISRKQWRKLDLPENEGRSQADRLEAAKGASAEIRAAEAAAIEQQVQPGAVEELTQDPRPPQEAAQATPQAEPGEQPVQPPVAPEGGLGAPPVPPGETESQSFEAMVAASPVPPQESAQRNLTKQVSAAKQPIGEAKGLVKDENGSISVPVETFAKAWRGTKTLLKRGFATGGLLPEVVQTVKLRKEGQQAKLSRQISEAQSDYKTAAKETYGTKNPSAVHTEEISDVLGGRSDISTLPDSMQDSVAAMRSGIDASSRELIRSGAVQGALAAIVARNTGVYLTRTFRAFSDPKWPSKVPEKVMNRAIALIRAEYPGKTEAEVHGLIAAILYEGKAAQTPLALIRRASLGAKDLGILRKRNLEIPEEILDLLGENRDPLVNYTQSMAKIGSLIANHKFLTEVREAGLAGGFFSEVPTVNEFGEMKTKIAKEGTASMEPLSGLYTTPEIADAFMRATDPKKIGPILRAYYRLNALVKTSKTVYSPQAIVRNFIANPLIAIKNGHIDLTGDYLGQAKDFWKAVKATGKDITPDWAKRLSNRVLPQFVNNLLAMNEKEFRAYMSRTAEAGVIGHDVIVGELKATLKDAGLFGADADIAGADAQRRGKTLAAFRVAGKQAVSIYQAGDSVWKLFGWNREMKAYHKAYPDMPQAELEQAAADIVTDVYPTYSKTSEFVGLMRKNILTGSFVSFPAEIIRTSFNTMELTRKEMTSDNPEVQKIGYRRLTGMISAATISIGVPIMSRFIAGVSADDEDDMRKFMPEWQRNSHVVHLSKSKAGNNRYIDMSYADPHSIIVKPLKAFFAGAKEDDIKAAFEESFREFFDPFISEEILIKALSEAWRNSKGANGLDVYNKEDTTFQKGLTIGQHVGRAFLPGAAVSAERIGRGMAGKVERTGKVRDPAIEAISVVTGQRIEEMDIRQNLSYISRSFSGSLRDSESIFRSVVNNRGSVSESSIIAAYERSDNARRDAFKEMTEVANAAVRLGVPAAEVVTIMREQGLTSNDVVRVMRGTYEPYQPTKARLKTMQRYNPGEFAGRREAWGAAWQSAINPEAGEPAVQ